MAITPLPPAPEPSDTQAQFNTKAFTFVAALDQFVTETNATAAAVNADAATATAQAAVATEQAAIATTKASEASASATQALNSANAAAASALEAAGLVEKYQGALAADPTLDKNGNPLTAGDWYINTTTGFVRVYNGGAWVQGISVVAGVSSINGLVGDLTGFVTETGAQTLTNKELVDPKIKLGGTNGTAGQVPVSQGAGLPPAWSNIGNAATATKLQTARILTIGNTGKSFDGSANVSWSLAEIGVTAFGLGGAAPAAGSPNDYLLGSFTAAELTESNAVSLGFPALGGGPSTPRHWDVITFGVSNRTTQIATEVFGSGTTKGRTFVRVKHDTTWFPWVELYSTANLRDTVEVISTNTTAVASRTYVLTASLTLTLPATPTAGDWVNVVNRSGTTTPVIVRNGQNIMGLAEDMILDNTNATLRLVFVGGTIGWVLN